MSISVVLERKIQSLFIIQDVIDIVKEQLYGHDYMESEDPHMYISNKTNRGPLTEDWIQEYWNEVFICHLNT